MMIILRIVTVHIRCWYLFLYFVFGSVRATTKLVSDNTGAFLQISRLQYHMGELEDALR